MTWERRPLRYRVCNLSWSCRSDFQLWEQQGKTEADLKFCAYGYLLRVIILVVGCFVLCFFKQEKQICIFYHLLTTLTVLLYSERLPEVKARRNMYKKRSSKVIRNRSDYLTFLNFHLSKKILFVFQDRCKNSSTSGRLKWNSKRFCVSYWEQISADSPQPTLTFRKHGVLSSEPKPPHKERNKRNHRGAGGKGYMKHPTLPSDVKIILARWSFIKPPCLS